MTTNQRLLAALGAAVSNEHVAWDAPVSDEAWAELFRLAEEHHVLPLVLEAVYECPAIRELDPRILSTYRLRSIRTVSAQTQSTSAFLKLYRHLRQAGLRPLVVKGIVCRQLYPVPDLRASRDEDVLIPEGDYARYRRAMAQWGLTPEGDEDAYEVSYFTEDRSMHIELHRTLFPPDSMAYGALNRFFTGAKERAVPIYVQGEPIETLGPTDHLLFLLLHAFKHFLHSGCGIRQVCDIALFAGAYGARIDWALVRERCESIRAERFAAALLRIGEKYFHLDPRAAGYGQLWQTRQTEEGPLLEDILSSGIFGKSSMSRLHSSNITLNAVSAGNRGKRGRASVIRTVFPPACQLTGRYPYLKKKPWLLPVAWTDRILKYRRETGATSGNEPMESVRIGAQRVELLRQYGILD